MMRTDRFFSSITHNCFLSSFLGWGKNVFRGVFLQELLLNVTGVAYISVYLAKHFKNLFSDSEQS